MAIIHSFTIGSNDIGIGSTSSRINIYRLENYRHSSLEELIYPNLRHICHQSRQDMLICNSSRHYIYTLAKLYGSNHFVVIIHNSTLIDLGKTDKISSYSPEGSNGTEAKKKKSSYKTHTDSPSHIPTAPSTASAWTHTQSLHSSNNRKTCSRCGNRIRNVRGVQDWHRFRVELLRLTIEDQCCSFLVKNCALLQSLDRVPEGDQGINYSSRVQPRLTQSTGDYIMFQQHYLYPTFYPSKLYVRHPSHTCQDAYQDMLLKIDWDAILLKNNANRESYNLDTHSTFKISKHQLMSPKLKQTISLFNSSKISSANSILSAKQMKPLDNNQRTSPTRYSSGQSRVQQTQVKDLSAIQNNNKEDEEEEATISFDSLLKDTIDGIVKRCDHSKTIQTSITYRNPTSNTQNTRQASYELSTSTSNLTDNQPPYSLNSPESDESNVSLHSSTESAYNPTSSTRPSILSSISIDPPQIPPLMTHSHQIETNMYCIENYFQGLDQDVDNHELKSENSFLERSDLASSFPSVIRRQYDRYGNHNPSLTISREDDSKIDSVTVSDQKVICANEQRNRSGNFNQDFEDSHQYTPQSALLFQETRPLSSRCGETTSRPKSLSFHQDLELEGVLNEVPFALNMRLPSQADNEQHSQCGVECSDKVDPKIPVSPTRLNETSNDSNRCSLSSEYTTLIRHPSEYNDYPPITSLLKPPAYVKNRKITFPSMLRDPCKPQERSRLVEQGVKFVPNHAPLSVRLEKTIELLRLARQPLQAAIEKTPQLVAADIKTERAKVDINPNAAPSTLFSFSKPSLARISTPPPASSIVTNPSKEQSGKANPKHCDPYEDIVFSRRVSKSTWDLTLSPPQSTRIILMCSVCKTDFWVTDQESLKFFAGHVTQCDNSIDRISTSLSSSMFNSRLNFQRIRDRIEEHFSTQG